MRRALVLVCLLLGCGGGCHGIVPPPRSSIAASAPADPPAAARLHYALGVRAWLVGDLARARTEIAVARLLDPHSAWLRMTEGRIAADQGDPEGARRALEEALRRDPDLLEAHRALRRLDEAGP